MNNQDRLTALEVAVDHVNFARRAGQDPRVLLAELGEPLPFYLANLPPYLLWRRVEVVLAEQWPALDHAACSARAATGSGLSRLPKDENPGAGGNWRRGSVSSIDPEIERVVP